MGAAEATMETCGSYYDTTRMPDQGDLPRPLRFSLFAVLPTASAAENNSPLYAGHDPEAPSRQWDRRPPAEADRDRRCGQQVWNATLVCVSMSVLRACVPCMYTCLVCLARSAGIVSA